MKALRSVKEAAGLLGISPWTVRSYIRDRKLLPVRLGRRVLISEDELERLVAKNTDEVQEQREVSESNVVGVSDT